MSQETRNEIAVSFQDSFFAQKERKAANCFVTGDFPVAQGTCSTTTLPQYRQLTRLIEYIRTSIIFQMGGSKNSRCFKWSYTDPDLPHREQIGLLFFLGKTGIISRLVSRHNLGSLDLE